MRQMIKINCSKLKTHITSTQIYANVITISDNDAAKPISKDKTKLPPSLRRDKQKLYDQLPGLDATPEFKSFIAKKLGEVIDR